MTRLGEFEVTAAPAGWLAWCIVAGCGFKARGVDQADALTAALEHAELVHLCVEPEPAR